MRSYRIGRADFPIADGRGAALSGTRWSAKGSAVVYTADSVGTAMMELFVHQPPNARQFMKMGTFEFPDTAIDQVNLTSISPDDDWAPTQKIGETWLGKQATAVLKVPSALVNGGWIYLLNPAHPDFAAFGIVIDDVSFEDTPTRLLKPGRSLDLKGLPGVKLETWNGLIDLQGRPLTSGGEAKARIEVRGLEHDLLAYLRAQPHMLLSLSPRDFERAMGAYYEDRGWRVELTPASKDGGKDLIIAKADEAGKRICYVECKRYDRDNPVSVGIIRQLWGVVDKDSVTSGIVATTSFFTKGAKAESQEKRMAHRMALYDYDALTAMLSATVGDAPR
ncbi:restriction endonuclease [Neorhizobium galegae]|uniref:restriction endonuclease n=1 Tax=Neorhizobium galegae TaxID=399 RepID=UPI000621E276|nr:RES domain-containing protein [Neorhizobium galegae]MCQ1805816.1 restriction endonuclease [Neorhizobium galegae]CDZ59628.1 Hypothetical protein NGAL_HAMBI2566_36030 [Neorhizobium galegae bv. orientalis]